MKNATFLAFLGLLIAAPAHAATDWSKVDEVLGRHEVEQPGKVHRHSFPRDDLQVVLAGVYSSRRLRSARSWTALN